MAAASPAKPAVAGAGAGAAAPTPTKGGALLNVVGAGSKGIAELGSKVQADTVTFALVRVPFGSGTFARDKCILLHVNSGKCSPLRTAAA